MPRLLLIATVVTLAAVAARTDDTTPQSLVLAEIRTTALPPPVN